MLPLRRMPTITGSLQVYALASLCIVCVLTSQISANSYNVSRNESIDNNVSEAIIESVRKEPVLKHKNQVLSHNETYSNVKIYNINQKQIQKYENNGRNKYSLNNLTENIDNKHNKSTYIILKSNKIVTIKQNKTISKNTFQSLEELASTETGEYLKQETEKDLLWYSRDQHSGNEDLLVQKYFKQYKLPVNINATITKPVVVSSFNNSKKLAEIMTKEESSNKSQIHPRQQSTTSSTEESRQLSPGEFGYYFIGPKLCDKIEWRNTDLPKKIETGHIKGRNLKQSDNEKDSYHLGSNRDQADEISVEVYPVYTPVQSSNYSFKKRIYSTYPFDKYPLKSSQINKYHPKFFEKDVSDQTLQVRDTEGEGEVREEPLSSGQQTDQSGSDQGFAEDSYLQAATQGNVPQGSEIRVQSDNVPSDSYSIPIYQPSASSGDYNYQPPPAPSPPPTEGYHYPQPSNQYLPDPSEPEEISENDYTYYFLGPKLWFIPLFFFVYAVAYIGVLIIVAVSRHGILFSDQMYNAATIALDEARSEDLNLLLNIVRTSLRETKKKYL